MLQKFVVAAMLVFGSLAANAVPIFDGQDLRLDYLFPDDVTVFNSSVITVGSGVDQVGFADRSIDEIDIFGTTILFDYQSSGVWSARAFNGPRFTDLNGTIDDIAGFIINPLTNMADFNETLITFSADSIQWNWAGLDFDADTIVAVDVEFARVPEPSTLALLGIGLFGMGLARRRKAV